MITADHRHALRSAVLNHRNILIAGGTNSGKTTLANAVLKEVTDLFPRERLVILDTPSSSSAVRSITSRCDPGRRHRSLSSMHGRPVTPEVSQRCTPRPRRAPCSSSATSTVIGRVVLLTAPQVESPMRTRLPRGALPSPGPHLMVRAGRPTGFRIRKYFIDRHSGVTEQR